MRRLLVVLFACISIVVFGQMYDPVQWVFSQRKISENEIELKFKANIEKTGICILSIYQLVLTLIQQIFLLR